MERTTAFMAFSAVLTASTPDLAEKGFAISALDDQAKDVLQTVKFVAAQLDHARSLLCRNSALFNDAEKRIFDETFQHTEDAICHVAALAERSQDDMSLSGGRLMEDARVLYMLRDSPSIQVSRTALRSARQELDLTIAKLQGTGRQRFQLSAGHAPPHDSPPSREDNQSPPPTYEDSVRHFLTEGRRKNMARRASAMALAASTATSPQYDRSRSSSVLSAPPSSFRTIPELDIPELAADETYRTKSMPTPQRNDLNDLPSQLAQQRPPSFRLSPDMSIPEVMQSGDEQKQRLTVEISPKSSHSRPSSVDLRTEDPARSSTPLSRRMENGRKTGRARTQSWLEARALT